MMNFIKIQTEAVKGAYERVTRNKQMYYICGEYKDTIAIGSRYHLIFIPKHLVFVDLDKVFPDKFNVERLIDESDPKYRPAVMTTNAQFAGKRTLVMFKCGDEEIWIDEAYLKQFDTSLATFKGRDKLSGIYVYEGDTLVGFILPVRRNEVI